MSSPYPEPFSWDVVFDVVVQHRGHWEDYVVLAAVCVACWAVWYVGRPLR